MLYRDDDDTTNGEDDCKDDVVMHTDEYAYTSRLSIDGRDRWLMARDDVQNNAMRIALTKTNGDNHFTSMPRRSDMVSGTDQRTNESKLLTLEHDKTYLFGLSRAKRETLF